MTPPAMTPLDWPALVAEALRRRKAERLTQREHAALAGVSIPTMVAFDRAERTLSLAKAFAILRVVGLLREADPADPQDGFVAASLARWQALVAPLPPDAPARFPHGVLRLDWALEGPLRPAPQRQLAEALDWTGLPLREVDGALEGPATAAGFCRAAPEGRVLLLRGHAEDAQETFPPGTLLDTTLPIWRLGEAMLHAVRLAPLLADSPQTATLRFRALYSGLAGRVLRSWANPLAGPPLVTGHAARADEALLTLAAPTAAIAANLAAHILPLAASLFERFGVIGLTEASVAAELDRMRRSRFPPEEHPR